MPTICQLALFTVCAILQPHKQYYFVDGHLDPSIRICIENNTDDPLRAEAAIFHEHWVFSLEKGIETCKEIPVS